ncbi:MAG: hypothetical protein CMQ84_04655 [Gammaproteobacteria bacterium]|nr:hypothetical protein [Gammaproteobacteria bacterium]OUX78081.1 MAG: hypothetical protein CBC19_05355 [Oceanospirillales bacterium TMED59]
MEGIARAFSTMLLGTKIQWDHSVMTQVGTQSSALINLMMRSRILTARSHLVLHGRRLIASSFGWAMRLRPKANDGAHFFLVRNRLLGKMFWSAQ